MGALVTNDDMIRSNITHHTYMKTTMSVNIGYTKKMLVGIALVRLAQETFEDSRRQHWSLL